MEDAVTYLRETLGPTLSAVVVIVVLPFVIYWKGWGEARFRSAAEAAGKKGAAKELAEHQAELTENLERTKQALNVQTEAAKADFQRHATSYAMFAQRRHEAVTQLHSALLAAREKAAREPRGLLNREPEVYRAEMEANIIEALGDFQKVYLSTAIYLSKRLDSVVRHLLSGFHELAKAQLHHDGFPYERRDRAKFKIAFWELRFIEAAQAEIRDPDLPEAREEFPEPQEYPESY